MQVEQREGYRLWVGGPVPKGSDGITLGSLVIVREGKATPYLLRHEQVHVRQWRRYGAVGFTARYLGSYVLWRLRRKGHKGAYRRIPMEIEADWVARRQLATAVRDELPASVAS
ncbi:MAG TPA: hypothetical protein PLV13_12420 [Ilumatobacteraceae bacterium]|nr:hypothetical protein [Ilumatobacteraceae bacterium]